VAVLVCLVAAIFFLWKIVKLHRAEPAMWAKPGREEAERN
jgi:hypothetical protein